MNEFKIDSSATVEYIRVDVLYNMIDFSNTFQRPIDKDHLQVFTDNELKFYEKYGRYSSSINLIKIAKLKDKYFILDGQHRLEFYRNREGVDKIPIIILNIETHEEYVDYFKNINSNKPVVLYDEDLDFIILNKFAKFLNDKFPKYIKTSKKPNYTNFNLDSMKKYFKDRNIIRKLNIDNVDILIEATIKLNNYYKKNHNNLSIGRNIAKTIKYAKKVNNKNTWYNGMFRNFEWIEFICIHLIDNKEFKEITHIISNKRVNINKKMRQLVWEKVHPKLLHGKCDVCEDEISVYNFESGHIQSVCKGGKTLLNNLIPICSDCNKSMGIIDLNEYKEQYIRFKTSE